MTDPTEARVADLLPRPVKEGESPTAALEYFLWADLYPALQNWAEGRHDGGTRLFAIKEIMERRQTGN